MGPDPNSAMVTPKLDLFPVQPSSPDSGVTALGSVDRAETIRSLGPGTREGGQSQARGVCVNWGARCQEMLTWFSSHVPQGVAEPEDGPA